MQLGSVGSDWVGSTGGSVGSVGSDWLGMGGGRRPAEATTPITVTPVIAERIPPAAIPNSHRRHPDAFLGLMSRSYGYLQKPSIRLSYVPSDCAPTRI